MGERRPPTGAERPEAEGTPATAGAAVGERKRCRGSGSLTRQTRHVQRRGPNHGYP